MASAGGRRKIIMSTREYNLVTTGTAKIVRNELDLFQRENESGRTTDLQKADGEGCEGLQLEGIVAEFTKCADSTRGITGETLRLHEVVQW